MPMQFKRKSCSIEITPELEEDLQKTLGREYTPLISSSQTKYKKYLTDYFQPSRISGEIFLVSEKVVFYYHLKPEQNILEAGGVFSQESEFVEFNKYLTQLEKIIANRTRQKVLFEEIVQTHSFFQYVQAESTALEYPKEDLVIAEILKNENLRKILRKASQGIWLSLSSNNNLEPENLKEQEAFYQKLEELGLIKKEYVVFCRETNNQISRTNSLDIIREAKARGFKCFSCGRNLDEEKLEQFIELTPLGERFAKPNYWLFLNLIKECQQNGLAPKELLVKEERHTLDWFVYFYPYCLMFEIKEEPLRLGDVLGFLLRAQYYHADYAFIFSLGNLPSEVEYFLKQPQKVSFSVFSSFYDIPNKLPRILEKLQADYIRNNLERLSDITQVRLDESLKGFFKELSLREPALPEVPSQPLEVSTPPEIIEEKAELLKVKPEALPEIPEVSEKAAPPEDVLSKIYAQQKQIEEKVLAVIKEFKKNKIITENYQRFEELLSQINKINGWSGAVLDLNSGLYLFNFLDSMWKTDLIGPILSQIAFNVQWIFEDLKLSSPKSIFLKTNNSQIQLYYISEDILLLVLREPIPELEKSKGIFKPKDAILKDLLQYEKIQGALIIDSNKKIIGKELKKPAVEKTLEALAIQIVLEQNDFYKQLELGAIEQVLISDSKTDFYFLFIKKQNILVITAAPEISEEIWYQVLPQIKLL